MEYRPTECEYDASKYHAAAYITYADGLILEDAERVVAAGHELAEADTPFRGDLLMTGKLDKVFYEDPDAYRRLSVTFLRAYAYASVPVEPGVVRLLSQRAGIDEPSLRKLLLPTHTLICGQIDQYGKTGLSKWDKAVLTLRGLDAIIDCGLSRFTDRLYRHVVERKMPPR
ncbi:MAG: hypothetical protein WD467_00610 [Candidatus Saccharimonadales bacterium]